MTDDAIVQAIAEATRWEFHGVRYGDDDVLDCMCGWSATGQPDRAHLYHLHQAEVALAAARPLIRAQAADEVDAVESSTSPTAFRSDDAWCEYREGMSTAARIVRDTP